MVESLLYTAVGVQLLYHSLLLYQFLTYRQDTKVDKYHDKEVSVVICARNEAENLQANLPTILNQDYKTFEVIVVDDASEDETYAILQDLQSEYTSLLKVVRMESFEKITAGKKGALDIGIQHTQYENLLLTDADCKPASNFWLKEMVSLLSEGDEMVLGISPYTHDGSWLHEIVAYETWLTMFQYIGYALWGHAYMGVGRNIAYTRKLFNEVGGFQSHLHFASGDDDLFVQQAIRKTNPKVCLSADAYTYSKPPKTFKAWWRQKTRHYTTGQLYTTKHKLLLGAFLLSKVSLYISLFSLLLLGKCTVGIALAYLLHGLVLTFTASYFKSKHKIGIHWSKAIILDPIYTVTVVLQGVFSFKYSKSQWS